MVASLTVINDALTGGRSFSPSSCNPNGRCGNGLEKVYPTCAVRYGYMNYIGEFRYAPGMLFGCGARVVIQTGRGIEIGQMVSLTCSGCEKSVGREQLLEYVKNSGPDFFALKAGRILRVASAQDIDEERHINADAAQKLKRAREIAAELGLQIKFVCCEHLFGGERILFHFMAEGRVDFRELVRQLAHEYHTRIEMHQVGARDEARLVADYEICGRECCCKNFLKTLRPVTMRMAKLQKATLDPAKVSGRCGRLRCCLRYEHEGYETMDKKLPRVGARVRTDRGVGTVRDRQVLTQLLTIHYDSNNQVETVGVEMIVERDLPRPPAGAPGPGEMGRGEPNRSGGRQGQPRERRNDDRRPSADRRPPDSQPARPPRIDETKPADQPGHSPPEASGVWTQADFGGGLVDGGTEADAPGDPLTESAGDEAARDEAGRMSDRQPGDASDAFAGNAEGGHTEAGGAPPVPGQPGTLGQGGRRRRRRRGRRGRGGDGPGGAQGPGGGGGVPDQA